MNLWALRHFIRSLLLNASMKALSVGFPGRIKMRRNVRMNSYLLKQLGVGAHAHEADPAFVHLIDQQEVAADMTFQEAIVIANQSMLQPFGPQGSRIGDEQQHGFLDAVEVTEYITVDGQRGGRVIGSSQ